MVKLSAYWATLGMLLNIWPESRISTLAWANKIDSLIQEAAMDSLWTIVVVGHVTRHRDVWSIDSNDIDWGCYCRSLCLKKVCVFPNETTSLTRMDISCFGAISYYYPGSSQTGTSNVFPKSITVSNFIRGLFRKKGSRFTECQTERWKIYNMRSPHPTD